MDTKKEKEYRSLGEILRDCREQRGLSVEDVSESTKISPRVLSSLEADGVGELAGPLYVRSFVKTLAAFYDQDEAWLLTRLETLDQEATRPVAPVSLPKSDSHIPLPTPKTVLPKPPREVTTWRVETVDDTTVKRIEGRGTLPNSRAWWILLAIVVLLLVFWLVRRGGSEAQPLSTSNAPGAHADEMITRGSGASDDGFVAGTQSAQASQPTANALAAQKDSTEEDRASVVVPARESKLANAVPEPGKPSVNLDRAILAGGDAGSAPARQNPSPAVNTPKPKPAADDSSETQPPPKQPPKSEAADDNLQETEPTESSPAPIQTTQERPAPQETKSVQRLGSIVRPGLKPPVAGELALDLRATRATEVRVSVDGGSRQRRTLAAGEVWHLTGRDHFSLFFADPTAMEVRLNDTVVTPPAGLDGGEWLLYPHADSQ